MDWIETAALCVFVTLDRYFLFGCCGFFLAAAPHLVQRIEAGFGFSCSRASEQDDSENSGRVRESCLCTYLPSKVVDLSDAAMSRKHFETLGSKVNPAPLTLPTAAS